MKVIEIEFVVRNDLQKHLALDVSKSEILIRSIESQTFVNTI